MNIKLIIIIFFLLVIVDIYFGLKRRRSGKLEFQFSRYNMFTQKPGKFEILMQSKFYNLPENKNMNAVFEIEMDGFLDKIESCDVVLCGGSAAFGTGSSSNANNLSGILKRDYNLKIINLAIPGYNIEQEVITVLKYLNIINPKKVILFDGANNLGFALPFDYHGYNIGKIPNPFYRELFYAGVVNDHFSKKKNIQLHLEVLLNEIASNSILLKPLYFLLEKLIGNIKRKKHHSMHEEINSLYNKEISFSIRNYIHWLNLLKDICKLRKIELYVFLQPFYIYGRDRDSTIGSKFYRENVVFDSAVVFGYESLHEELLKIDYIKYNSIFKNFALENINNFIDPVHLNDAGYRLVAETIIREIGDYK